ncbi:MAG: T9SS type A sorting domain-containing protein [Arcticibacter sp.]
MKRIILVHVFLLMFQPTALSQGRNNLWMMGYGGLTPPTLLGGIDVNFSSGQPIISYVPREMEFKRAVSTITDSSGNLLFVTNGFYITDASGDTMQNGSGLNPSIYTSWYPDGLPPPQMNIILPDPGQSNIYHLFHCTLDDPPSSIITRFLYHSIIDMNSNGGFGAVITKNQVVFNDSLNGGRITACKHANGRDWWIMVHKANTNIYHKYLLTPYGLFGPFSQSIGSIRYIDLGQAAFSFSGEYFAWYSAVDDLDIFRFDRCTGMLSNPIHVTINDSATVLGVAFSPSSQFLYVSSTNYVYQFDVTAANIQGTQTTVAVWDSFYSPNPPFGTYFDIAQLAPDGKIYIATGNSTLHLHVINQPDSAGLACDLVQHGIPLPAFNYNSLPNHPNYFLGALIGSPCDSLTGINDDQAFDFKFGVYPNPNSGVFNIGYQLPQNTAGVLEFYDVNGSLIWSRPLPAWSTFQKILLSDKITSGIYLIALKAGNGYSTRKLMIDKN